MEGKLFYIFHKKFVLQSSDELIPIGVGRKMIVHDGNIDPDSEWLIRNTLGDDSGDNISEKDSYCECRALYWIWKNIKQKETDYIGFFQYRRFLILNDLFEKDDTSTKDKTVYKTICFNEDDQDVWKKIGLDKRAIENYLQIYDCIIPYQSELDKMNVKNIYMDWCDKIRGVHLADLLILENYIKENYPDLKDDFSEYLNGSKKLMFQIFICKRTVFDDYCRWMFDIAGSIENKINCELYSANGKRTIGYLCEILYGFYFSYIAKYKYKIKECGVAMLKN